MLRLNKLLPGQDCLIRNKVNNYKKGVFIAMGEMAQLALSNFLVFAVAVILIIYIIYLFIKRMVEKNDGDFTSQPEMKQELNRWAILRKFIFTFLYSAMTACFIYLMDSDKTGAITYFVIFFIAGLLTPERTRKRKPSKSKVDKIFRYTILLVLLILFVIFTVTSTANIISKVSAWLILFIIYLLEKIEKKYFISENMSSHDL